MDAFSEVLNGVRLKGALFFTAAFSAPWRLSTPNSRELTLVPDAAHMVIYHLVVDGSARASLDDGRQVDLSPGDIVVFPQGDAHHLSAGTGKGQIESAAVLQKIANRDLSPLQSGGGGATTRFVCGYLMVEEVSSDRAGSDVMLVAPERPLPWNTSAVPDALFAEQIQRLKEAASFLA